MTTLGQDISACQGALVPVDKPPTHLQHQDLRLAILCQLVGKDATSSPGTDNDVVVLLLSCILHRPLFSSSGVEGICNEEVVQLPSRREHIGILLTRDAIRN